MNRDIDTIRVMCQELPTNPKLIIIPSRSLQTQVFKSLNDAGISPMNLEVTTLADIAISSVAFLMARDNLILLNDNDITELVRTVFGKLNEASRLKYFDAIEATKGLYKAVASTLIEMKYSGWKQGMINFELIQNKGKRSDIELIMNEYNDMLKQSSFIDMADVVEIACVTAETNIKYERIYLLEGCQLTYIEEQLMHVIGWDKPETEDSYLMDYKAALNHIDDISLKRTYGIHSEVKEVLRTVLQKNLPFDQVLIVAMSNSPYSHILYKLIAQYTINNHDIATEKQMPITFGLGLPATITSPIKLILSLLDWIDSGYSVHGLVRMFSDGVMKLEGLISNNNEMIVSREMLVQVLKDSNITWQRATYMPALQQFSEISEKKRMVALLLIRFIKEEIFDVIPEADSNGVITVEDFLEGIKKFVSRNTAIKSAIDKQGLVKINEELKTVIKDMKLPLAEVVTIIREQINSLQVAEESPSEGKIHFTTIKGAEWIQRKYLFLIGNDANTFLKNSNEDPVLLDKERSNTLKKSSDKYVDDIKAISRFFLEVKEPIIASYSYFDTTNNRDMFPSLVFMGMQKKNGQEKVIRTIDMVLDDISDSIDEADYVTTKSVKKPSLGDDLIAEVKPILITENISEHPYDERFDPRKNGMVLSSSMLQTYMECEYRYFLKYILNLKEITSIELDKLGWLSYLEIGKLYHSIFETFMDKTILDKDILLSQETANNEIEKIAKEFINMYEKRLPVASEYHTKKEKLEILKNCRRFALNEVDQKNDIVPLEFEFVFGKTELLKLELPDESSIAVTGVVDRMDKVLKDNSIKIIDYKTGSTFGYDVLNDINSALINAKSIQPILYYLALKALDIKDINAAVYVFVTSKGDYDTYEISFETVSDEMLKQGLVGLLDKISTGIYKVVEDDFKCRYCPYAEVCKRQEVESE